MHMLKKLSLLFFLVVILALTGCASKMALSKGQTRIETGGKGIVLVPITVTNHNRPGYEPNLTTAVVSGTENMKVNVEDSFLKEEPEKSKDFLVSFSLAPGTYTLETILAYYDSYLIKAHCDIPLKAAFEAKRDTVTYLGHVTADIVERKNDSDVRAGSWIPLIDQSVAGFSTGTFLLSVSDRYEEDLANYIKEYPGLQGVTVHKTILPQVAAK